MSQPACAGVVLWLPEDQLPCGARLVALDAVGPLQQTGVDRLDAVDAVALVVHPAQQRPGDGAVGVGPGAVDLLGVTGDPQRGDLLPHLGIDLAGQHVVLAARRVRRVADEVGAELVGVDAEDGGELRGERGGTAADHLAVVVGQLVVGDLVEIQDEVIGRHRGGEHLAVGVQDVARGATTTVEKLRASLAACASAGPAIACT